MALLPHIHHHQVAFQAVDPLGDGLGDEIAEERREDDNIDLKDQFDPEFGDRWDKIVEDVRKDPNWFDFADDND